LLLKKGRDSGLFYFHFPADIFSVTGKVVAPVKGIKAVLIVD
jgi:hypothetical protein